MTIHLLDDGSVLAVGGFYQQGAFEEDQVGRLTSAGAVDAVFETPAGASFVPWALAVRPDGSFTVQGKTYKSRSSAEADLDLIAMSGN